MSRISEFRQRLRAHDALIGTWVKTPSPIIAEVLALTDLDVVCLDAEHAPFGRLELDQALQVLRLADMPALVRIPDKDPGTILNALDCGATGIVVPHVTSVAEAKATARAARFGDGGRGYAGSTRAAGFTTRPMADNLRASTQETVVIAQIEDLPALEALDAIAEVDGIDCLFIGRIDLTVALGAATPNEPAVIEIVDRICAAGQQAGRAVGMFTPAMDEIPDWRTKGASLFLLNSDQGFILAGAKKLVSDFKDRV